MTPWNDPVKAIAKPASADSLAGVLSRLFPSLIDSASVDGIQWRQSPKDRVGMTSAADYGYRGAGYRDRFKMLPLVAKTDRQDGTPVITFASRDWPFKGGSWADEPNVVKHEMFHAMSPNPKDWGHYPERGPMFKLFEEYRGR